MVVGFLARLSPLQGFLQASAPCFFLVWQADLQQAFSGRNDLVPYSSKLETSTFAYLQASSNGAISMARKT